MADKNAPEVKRTLVEYGFKVRDDKSRKNESGEDPGRADLACIKRGQGVFVEVKHCTKYFKSSQWEPHQRRWAEETLSQNGSETYIWIDIGTNRPDATKQKGAMPRKSYCIPHTELLKVVEKHDFITYRSGQKIKGHRPDPAINFIDLFPEYELIWDKGLWKFQEHHIFFVTYLSDIKIVTIAA